MDTKNLSASKKSDFYNWQFLRLKPDYIDFAEHFFSEYETSTGKTKQLLEKEWFEIANFHYGIKKIYHPSEDFPDNFEIMDSTPFNIFLESFNSLKYLGKAVFTNEHKPALYSLNPFQSRIPSKKTLPVKYQPKKPNQSPYLKNKVFKEQLDSYLDINRFAVVIFDLWSPLPSKKDYTSLQNFIQESRDKLLKYLREKDFHKNQTNDEVLLKRTIIAYKYWKQNSMCSAYQVSKSRELSDFFGLDSLKEYTTEQAQDDINRAIRLILAAPNIPFSFDRN